MTEIKTISSDGNNRLRMMICYNKDFEKSAIMLFLESKYLTGKWQGINSIHLTNEELRKMIVEYDFND